MVNYWQGRVFMTINSCGYTLGPLIMPPTNRRDQRAGAIFKVYIHNHKGRQRHAMMRRHAAIRARRANPAWSRTFDAHAFFSW
jgi:hypothetical protein